MENNHAEKGDGNRIRRYFRKLNSMPQYIKYPIIGYAIGIVVITIILLSLRIAFSLDDSRAAFLRDVDFYTLHDLMKYSIADYYKYSTIEDFRALYLYFWYFIFYPFYLIPLPIGLYVWDALRVVSSLYVCFNSYKLIEWELPQDVTKKILICFDLCVFVGFSGVGYFSDAYLNNTNWLIQLFLFQSYLEYNKGKKLRSGLLFLVACYKINVLLFPFILFIVKKIKFKDLVYYLVPFAIMFLPYIIFPDYFMEMYYNWTYLEQPVEENLTPLLQLYILSWQAFQTGQLMYMGMVLTIFNQNINEDHFKEKYMKFRFPLILIIVIIVASINISFPMLLWVFYEL